MQTEYSGLESYKDTDLGFTYIDELNNKNEVKWLNKIKDDGVGYDFVKLMNDVETEYVEVKTTIKLGKTFHLITAKQWGFARRLFNQGVGEKYVISRKGRVFLGVINKLRKWMII